MAPSHEQVLILHAQVVWLSTALRVRSGSEQLQEGQVWLQVGWCPRPHLQEKDGSVALTWLTTRIQGHYNVHCFTGDQTTTLACCVIKTKRGNCRELRSATP